ncbi:MAG TPA: APC family permease [Gemmataceae bacterium]|nr:APC family permease [Gemmataceae bacterium]
MPATLETMPPAASSGGLLRVLGTGFGLAVTVGGTVGLGILRAPGEVAVQLPDARLIVGVWALGGLYALLGALSVAELGTLAGRSGGFYVFARRALGLYPGFVVGWSDWLAACGSAAATALVLGEYAGRLVPSLADHAVLIALSALLGFGLLQGRGLRWGSRTQGLTSTVKALALLGLVVCCFAVAGPRVPPSPSGPAVPAGLALLAALVVALQAVVYTFDGWYAPLYFAGEVRQLGRAIPRAMIGGVLLVTAIYLLVNLALLAVVPLPQLAGHSLAVGAAAEAVFGSGGETVTGVLAILILLSVLNACTLTAPRVLFAMSADGFFVRRAAAVNRGGTPWVALWASIAAAAGFVLSGTFKQVLAVLAFFMVINYASAFIAVFVLRRREPGAARPYRAWGYPWSTSLVLAGSAAFLMAAVASDTRNSLWALALLALSYPVYRLLRPARPDDGTDPPNADRTEPFPEVTGVSKR